MAARTGLHELAEQRLRDVLPEFPLRDQALVLVGLHTGLRCRELLSLTVGQVWDGAAVRSTLRIERRNLKGGAGVLRRAVRSRAIPLHPVARAALGLLLEERTRTGAVSADAPVFLSRQQGRAITPMQAGRIVAAVIARAGLEAEGAWGVHSLRKTFARRIYERSGHDLDLTRVALGHRNVTTTQAYLATSEEDAAAAILSLGGEVKSAPGLALEVA